MSANMDALLAPSLAQRQGQSLYRRRHVVNSPQQCILIKGQQHLLSFCSNDYLGLANHPKVKEAYINAAKKYGVGSGAAHLVCGHSHEHHALEEELADFLGRPRALLFSTGYMANMGVINALCAREDVVYEDKLNHASLLDGGLLSSSKCVRYRHNDLQHLKKQLDTHHGKRKLIVVDGVFSMDGNFADFAGLVELAKNENAWLMVDDAHGIGCVGAEGRGCVEKFDLDQHQLPVLVGTLGKAFGTFGAFVSGSETLIEYLIQFARTYIYTTALPPAIAAATRESLRIICSEPERREHLTQLIQHFRELAEQANLALMPSSTAIQPIVVGASAKALSVSQKLEKLGFWVTAIRPPTVPEGSARLRVTLTAEHSLEQVTSLVQALKESVDAS